MWRIIQDSSKKLIDLDRLQSGVPDGLPVAAAGPASPAREKTTADQHTPGHLDELESHAAVIVRADAEDDPAASPPPAPSPTRSEGSPPLPATTSVSDTLAAYYGLSALSSTGSALLKAGTSTAMRLVDATSSLVAGEVKDASEPLVAERPATDFQRSAPVRLTQSNSALASSLQQHRLTLLPEAESAQERSAEELGVALPSLAAARTSTGIVTQGVWECVRDTISTVVRVSSQFVDDYLVAYLQSSWGMSRPAAIATAVAVLAFAVLSIGALFWLNGSFGSLPTTEHASPSPALP